MSLFKTLKNYGIAEVLNIMENNNDKLVKAITEFKKIAADKQKIGRAKAGQGKYVLRNLQSQEYSGGN